MSGSTPDRQSLFSGVDMTRFIDNIRAGVSATTHKTQAGGDKVLKDIKTGEMIDVLREWSTEEKMAIFNSYPLTKPYPDLFRATADDLIGSVKSREAMMSDEEKKRLSALLGDLDREFDDLVRAIDSISATFALAFPDRAAEYQTLKETLFPEGLSIVNSSYRNEAGETERIFERVEAKPQVRAIIEETTLNGVSLTSWFDRLVDVGRRIGPIAARYNVQESKAEAVLLEFKARQRWLSMVTTMRRTTQLAGWTPEHTEAIFGQVDRISASRDRARGNPTPTEDTPEVEPTPEPAPTA
jgi:hypothetical protein